VASSAVAPRREQRRARWISPPAHDSGAGVLQRGHQTKTFGYWGWYYFANPSGFNSIAPRRAKVYNDTLYRAAWTVLDIHELANTVPVAPTIGSVTTPRPIRRSSAGRDLHGAQRRRVADSHSLLGGEDVGRAAGEQRRQRHELRLADGPPPLSVSIPAPRRRPVRRERKQVRHRSDQRPAGARLHRPGRRAHPRRLRRGDRPVPVQTAGVPSGRGTSTTARP
jgi:hypothetical protein